MTIGSKLIFLENTQSTNNYAADLVKKEKCPEGTVICSGYQSGGRGQQGNTWESEPGKNLLLSLVLYPKQIKPEKQFIISMAVSLAICDFLKSMISGCSIKWPNDIFVINSKIAGILIENSIMGDTIEATVAGIGLNINQTRFSGYNPAAISLKMITGKDYDLRECLMNLISDINNRYGQVLSGKEFDIRNDYISSLYGYMEWRNFLTGDGILRGRITSVSDSGLLLVEDESGRTNNFQFKEIDFRI